MSAEYVLRASVFYQRQEDGSRKRFRQGDTVTGLSAAEAKRLLGIKAIGRVKVEPPAPEPTPEPPSNDDGAAGSGSGGGADDGGQGSDGGAGDPGQGGDDGSSAPAVEKPAQIATKAALVDWLADHPKPKHGKSRAELEALNKDQLWVLVNDED